MGEGVRTAHCFKEGKFSHFLGNAPHFKNVHQMNLPQAKSDDALLGNVGPLHPGWRECIMMQCLSAAPRGCGPPHMRLLTRQSKGVPMTTRLRSCFPPCRFSNPAFTSIRCLSLPDFLPAVGVQPSSSDVGRQAGWAVDFGVPVSGTLGEAMLTSSPGGPL